MESIGGYWSIDTSPAVAETWMAYSKRLPAPKLLEGEHSIRDTALSWTTFFPSFTGKPTKKIKKQI